MISESVVTLIGDLLVAQSVSSSLALVLQALVLRLRACRISSSSAVFTVLNFLRIGPEIKCEEPRHQALHLACADIIGQAHLLANANEETRSEIAARFIDQFQRVPVWTDKLAPRNPTMITPCALSLRLSTVSGLPSGMEGFASVSASVPGFILPSACSTSCFTSAALTSPKT